MQLNSEQDTMIVHGKMTDTVQDVNVVLVNVRTVHHRMEMQ